MKKLLITYKMQNQNETVETCIALPMTDETSKDILAKGETSEHLQSMTLGETYRALKSIAALQGYDYAGFCTAEEVKN